MCGSMADIQSLTAKNRRGKRKKKKKKKKKKKERKKERKKETTAAKYWAAINSRINDSVLIQRASKS